MKCPKCHYLSFDPEPRCRNCGFSLSLEAPDLPIAVETAASSPLADLELRPADADALGSATVEVTKAVDDAPIPSGQLPASVSAPLPRPVRRVASAPRARTRSAQDEGAKESLVTPLSATAPSSPNPTTELPLFVRELTDEVDPASQKPSRSGAALHDFPVEPRALDTGSPAVVATSSVEAVRAMPTAARGETLESEVEISLVSRFSDAKSASEVTSGGPSAMWSSARRKVGPVDRDLPNDVARITRREQQAQQAEAGAALADRAGVGRRLAAAVVDGLILAAILSALTAVTLRWTLLGWDDLAMLSAWPTSVFFGLVSYWYLSLFTAATGQTLGKMLVGIRVVALDADGTAAAPLSPARACLRELIALPSMLMLGLGFWPALVGTERGLHDRLAATRVVRA